MGRFDNCVNILETAIRSQNTCLSEIHSFDEKLALFSLYRTFIETLLNSDTYKETHRIQILNIMKQIVPGDSENQLMIVEQYLENCVKTLLEENCIENEEDTYFLPNLKCDTIVCYVYFLYIRGSDINRIMSIYKNCINHFKEYHYIQVLHFIFSFSW